MCISILAVRRGLLTQLQQPHNPKINLDLGKETIKELSTSDDVRVILNHNISKHLELSSFGYT